MFQRLGSFTYRRRFAVLAVMIGALLCLGTYGFDIAIGKHLSQGGYFDEGSQSAQASRLLDDTFGRDHNGDVIVLYTAGPGQTIDDPAFAGPIVNNLNSLPVTHSDEISKVNGAYWQTKTGEKLSTMGTQDKYAFASIALKGDDDTTVLNNYQKVKDAFAIPGITTEVAGRQPLSGTIANTMAEDIHRMEILAIPAVAVLLFFIFGGVVAAALPLIVGGLTVIGGWGVIRILTNFSEVNGFVSPVISMVGLGLAIDYGLFIVSRFREELAEGYDTQAAVRRSVMTSGRTVAMSVTIIVASCGALLLFPQGFLKSLAYGAIAAVSLAGIVAVTVLPAMLSILGPRVDALGFKWMRKTKTNEEIEASIWGRLTRFVMRNPLKVAIPIVIGLSLLIIPVKNISFGGVSEKLLPPNDPTRVAQEHFDTLFPTFRTDPLVLVIEASSSSLTGPIRSQANKAPGIIGNFQQDNITRDGIAKYTVQLKDPLDVKPAMDYLRSMDVPDGATVMVAGTPVLQQDSLDALLVRIPLMVIIGVLVSTLLMFLTFGSVVLPIKAALMSALGLGSTLGILTWIFVDGNGSSLINFTAGPIFAPILVLIIALIYGLSVDYEVFLLSRMVEARALGASTTESVRVGMAHTSRIITAAALILIVVTGAFGFSKLVLMQYIAYGMIAALIIDATVLRMFLVPATMKLLGDDCWWAPAWLTKIQQKIGLGEPILEDERLPKDMPIVATSTPLTNAPEDALTIVIPTVETGQRARSSKPTPPRRVSREVASPEPPRPPGNRMPPPGPPARPRPPASRPQPPQAEPVKDRRSIEDWLSDLRSPNRPTPGPADPDKGRHHGGGDSVSVNDLLRRREP